MKEGGVVKMKRMSVLLLWMFFFAYIVAILCSGCRPRCDTCIESNSQEMKGYVRCLDGYHRYVDTSNDYLSVPLKLLSLDRARHYVFKIENIVDYLSCRQSAVTLGSEEDLWPLECIVILWFQGFRDEVEMLWYEKDDRMSRALIMLLVLSNLEDDRIVHFLHECCRFEEIEREMRMQEILSIRKKRKQYSELVWVLDRCMEKLMCEPKREDGNAITE